jgi:putative endonuclease
MPSQGQQAEDLALAHLQRQGLQLVVRNYRCKGGEIDLIMRDGAVLAFVEVRYRKSARFGGALESVTATKQARIIRCAAHYMARHGTNQPARFDVVALEPGGEPLRVQWVKDAFRA